MADFSASMPVAMGDRSGNFVHVGDDGALRVVIVGDIRPQPSMLNELQAALGTRLSTEPGSLLDTLCRKIDDLENRIRQLEKTPNNVEDKPHPGYNSSFVLKI